MTDLSDLVNEANRERGWSLREIEKRAADRNFRLSHSTAGKVLNGTHGRINLETVFALNAVFGLDVDALTAAAELPSVGGLYEPPREAAFLDPRQRKAVTELILSIVNAKGGEAGAAGTPATKGPDSGPAAPNNVTELPNRRRLPAARKPGQPPKGDPKFDE